MNEAEIRADERQRCWEEINAMIKPGPLVGDGWDQTAQRNGLILAANQLSQYDRHLMNRKPPRPVDQ